MTAVQTFLDAASKGYMDRGTYAGYANLCLDDGDYTGALELTEKGLRHFKDDAHLLSVKGRALVRLDRHAEAEAPLRAALKLNPGNFPTLHGLALCLQGLASSQNPEYALEASQFFDAALEVNPNDKTCHNDYGILLFAMELFEAAAEQFKHAVELDPNNVAANANYGVCLMSLGENGPETHQHLRRAWAHGGDDAYEAGYYYVHSLLRHGDRHGALEVAKYVVPTLDRLGVEKYAQDLRDRLPEVDTVIAMAKRLDVRPNQPS